MEENDVILSEENDLPDNSSLLQVDLVVEDRTIDLCDDSDPQDTDKNKNENVKAKTGLNMYADEMLSSGLIASDLAYFTRAYENLVDVRLIKMHCTSCDKHLGTAPNAMFKRKEHPLLKVLVCEKCYLFYESGDFEKDEDGSELYCRWCGEGGQVYCCTKCPFVFCKFCITRNIGRGKATIIQNSEDWMCFACNLCQISRHRATYWAVQKYSQLMLKKYSSNTPLLSVDSTVCCMGATKRPAEKLKATPAKKVKTDAASLLLKTALQKRAESTNQTNWKNNVVGEPLQRRPDLPSPITWKSTSADEAEAEVICTPDIIPIDDSPAGSPEPPSTPPPLPPPLQPIPKANYMMRAPMPSLTPIYHMKQFAPQIAPPLKTIQPNVLMAPPQLQQIPARDNAYIVRATAPPVPPLNSQVNNNMKLLMTKTDTAMDQPNYLHSAQPSTSTGNAFVQDANDLNKTDNWFNLAVVNCMELTKFISTKVSALANVHQRPHKSTKTMEDLHNMLQTYLDVLIGKINKLKTSTKVQFEMDMELMKRSMLMNPNVQSVQSTSGNNESVSKEVKKTKIASSHNITEEHENMLLDMDVTTASDEEIQSIDSSRCSSPVNKRTECDQNVDTNIPDETELHDTSVITVIDSDDNLDKSINSSEDNSVKKNNALGKQDPNIRVGMSEAEVQKYLSAIVVIKNCKLSQKIFDKIAKQVSNTNDDTSNVANQISSTSSTDKSNNSVNINMSRICVKKLILEEDNVKMVINKIEDSLNSKEGNLSSPQSEAIPSPEKRNTPSPERKNISSPEREITSSPERENMSSPEDQYTSNSEKCDTPSPARTESPISRKESIEIPYDLEDILTTNIVVRTNNLEQKRGNEQSNTIKDPTELFLSEIESETIDKHQIDIARELDIIPDDVSDIINKDNGSLSLPPENSDFSMDEIERTLKFDSVVGESLFSNSNVNKEKSNVKNNEGNSELLLESEILALKQMAENCVTAADVRKASTECKG